MKKWYVQSVRNKDVVGIFEVPEPLQAALRARQMFELPLQGFTCWVWAYNDEAREYLKERGLVEPVVAGW